jgi:lysophospholipase L1-like esterase
MRPAKTWIWLPALLIMAGVAGYLKISQQRGPRNPQDNLDFLVAPVPATAVPCNFSASPRPMMVLVLGQSNAGNHGAPRPGLTDKDGAVFLHDGQCYRTSWPAPGATGTGGNIWSSLSSRLSGALGRPVVFSLLAVDATSVRDWATEGRLRRRLIDTLAANRQGRFTPDIVLWQQGEADARAGTSSDEYLEHFRAVLTVLRERGIAAPILVALSTRCRNDGSEEVRKALRIAAQSEPGVAIGPDLDVLTGSLREDGCHFSAAGLEMAAELWSRAILAER